MPEHRADCSDCPWAFEDADFVSVADAAEDHITSEVGHDVNVKRAVATDGGRDHEAVLDVLGEVEPCQEIEAMKGLLEGMTDEESLSPEDWLAPLKLTGGNVCLEVGGELGAVYFTHVCDDLFAQLPHEFEFDRPATIPGDHVVATIQTFLPEVTPVVRENTPFADAPAALRWQVRCKNEAVVDPSDPPVEASYTDREEARAEAIRLARVRDLDYGVWDAHESEFVGHPQAPGGDAA